MKISEKLKAMADLQHEEFALLKKLTKNVKKKPAKRTSTAFNRAFQAVAIVIRASQIHSEKIILASQPTGS